MSVKVIKKLKTIRISLRFSVRVIRFGIALCRAEYRFTKAIVKDKLADVCTKVTFAGVSFGFFIALFYGHIEQAGGAKIKKDFDERILCRVELLPNTL